MAVEVINVHQRGYTVTSKQVEILIAMYTFEDMHKLRVDHKVKQHNAAGL